MAKQQGSDLGDVKTRNNQDKVKVTDLIDIYKFPSQKYVTARLHGAMFSYAVYWVSTVNKEGKKTQFPVNSPSYDPATQDFDTTKYDPWRDLAEQEKAAGIEPAKRKVRVAINYYVNAILRSLQKNEPRKRPRPTANEKKTGFKEKASDSWTPNVVLRLTGNNVDKIKKFTGINTVDGKSGTRSYSVTHPKFGCDIRIQYDADAKSASNAYDIQFVDKKTPLSEEELAELTWDLSELSEETTPDEIKRDFEGWARRNKVEIGKPKSKSKKKGGEEEDYDDDFGDEEDDEDEKPKRGSSSKKKPTSTSKSKKSSRDEDEEDEDDDFGDDEDEDQPKSKKSTKKAPAKGKKSSSDDEDDEEDEDEDESEDEAEDEDDDSSDDDEDDEDGDDSDDEDDEDDADDEDERPSRAKAKSKTTAASKKSVKGKKPSRDEEEEDDEDDFGDDDEDEDDDEPVTKKKAQAKKTTTKKAPPAKKSTKKPVRKSRDDDEDEDEDDFGDD